MPYLLVAVVALTCLVILGRTSGWTSPGALMCLLSLLMVTGLVVLPLGFDSLRWAASLIWSGGLFACLVGNLIAARIAASRSAGEVATSGLRESRFAVLASVLALVQLLGVLFYRSRIGDLAGSDFSTLDTKSIRAAEGTGSGVTGLGALLFEVSPLLAVVGIIGALLLRKLWGLLTVLALVSAGLSPGRTFLLTTLAASIAAWWYVRTAGTSRRPRIPVVLAFVAAGLAGALLYFNVVASDLGKAEVSGIPTDTWLPNEFHSAGLYMLGGIPAMSDAVDMGMNPVEGHQGRSVYVFVKAISFVDPAVVPPETVAAYVTMPSLTNAYTGFGDAWFDGGVAGLTFVFLSYGLLSGWSFNRCRAGNIPMIWVAATVVAQVLALPVAGHLFELATVTWAIVGWLGLRWVCVRRDSLETAPSSLYANARQMPTGAAFTRRTIMTRRNAHVRPQR